MSSGTISEGEHPWYQWEQTLAVHAESGSKSEFLAALMMASSDPIIAIDAEQKVVVFNVGAENLLGLEAQNALGKPLTDVLPIPFQSAHRESVDNFIHATGPATRTGTIEAIEFERHDGKRMVIEASVTRFSFSSQVYVAAVIHDVTDRVQAERVAKENEKFLDSIIQGTNQVITRASYLKGDPNPHYDFISRLAAERTGISIAEMLQDPKLFFKKVHPDDLERFLKDTHTVRQSGNPSTLTYRVQLSDGSYRVLERNSRPTFDETGMVDHIYAFTVDITDRLDVEEKLRQSQNLYRMIVDGIGETVLFVTLDVETAEPSVTFISRQIESLLGFPSEVFQPDPNYIFELVHPEDTRIVQAVIDRLIHKKEVFSETLRVRNIDEIYRWIEVSVGPVERIDSKKIDVYCLARDVTQVRETYELQTAKEVAERSSVAKSQIISNLSHELRTPLNAILGYSQLLLEGDLDEKAIDYVASIQNAGDGLLEMVNDVLTIVQADSGKLVMNPEPVQLTEIFHRLSSQFETASTFRNPLDIGCSCPSSLKILCCPIRLEQILKTAIRYIYELDLSNPKLTISAELTQNDQVQISIKSVENGALDQKTKLEVSTPSESMNLKLTLCEKLVLAMGGQSSITSLRDGSKCFRLELPSSNNLLQAERVHPAIVLCIEDNPSNAELVRQVFKGDETVEIVVAEFGESGLTIAESGEIDLVLLDMNLPDISGKDVISRLKSHAQTADVPIIVTSADASRDRINAVLRAGANEYLTKPLNLSDLIEAVHEYTRINAPRKEVSVTP